MLDWLKFVASNASDYIKTDLQLVMQVLLARVNEVSRQVWEEIHGGSSESPSFEKIVQLILSAFAPAADYIVKNPQVLLYTLVPASRFWLLILGFKPNGIIPGSIAAALQSIISNVPPGPVFSFLLSYGAGGFACTAINIGGIKLLLAVLLAIIGKLLMDRGVPVGQVSEALEKIWSTIAITPPDFLLAPKAKL
ncbi:hypothetical protein BDD12DRAFT_896473 [Trichophaea hybrida]|nr:hypothetical protein BDD12DRAFT_896473 [Trichophaea hybrida]